MRPKALLGPRGIRSPPRCRIVCRAAFESERWAHLLLRLDGMKQYNCLCLCTCVCCTTKVDELL